MAIYTQLEFSEIEALLAPLKLGRLITATGVPAGVENTTYFLDLESNGREKILHQYVLTIAEALSRQDLEFIATLTHDFNICGLPVPAPVFSGITFTPRAAIQSVRAKPALLVPKISGTHPQIASSDLCHRIGMLLAELHLAALALDYRYESHRSLGWVATTGRTLLSHLAEADRELLNQELVELSRFVSTNNTLPQAVVHGDLFRDNVLEQGGRITAVIDFFSAGTGYLLFDLAVTVNDWCFDSIGVLNASNYRALIAGYINIRTPLPEEIKCWSEFLRIAALRFWVSRLNEKLISEPHAPLGRGKNPARFRQLVLRHRHSPLLWAL